MEDTLNFDFLSATLLALPFDAAFGTLSVRKMVL